MNRVAVVSSILIVAGCFLPWISGQHIGLENKEWLIVLVLGIVATFLSLFNEIKKPGRFQWLYTFIALGISGVLTLEVKMIINTNQQFTFSTAGMGLILVAIGTLGFLLSGLYFFPKLSIAAVVIAFGIALFVFKKLNAENADLSEGKADVTVDATTLINSFEKDSASASKQYIDKTVLVSGKIKSVDTSGVITLGEQGQMSSVQCSMDKRHAVNYNNLKEGMAVSITGKVNGCDKDDLLGTDIKINFCVIDNKK